MTVCKRCGQSLQGKQLRAFNRDGGLVGFLKGHAEPGQRIVKPGEPGYTELQGFIQCDCGRQIAVSPKIIREGSEIYDEL